LPDNLPGRFPGFPQWFKPFAPNALGEPFPLFIDDQRDVRERWDRKTERLVEEDLPCCGGEQVSASHHLIDLHQGIIDHYRELIGEDAIGAAHNEIANRLLHVLLLWTDHQINEGDDTFVIDAQTIGGTARSCPFAALRRGEMATGAGIARAIFCSLLWSAGGMRDLCSTAIAWIDQFRFLQLLQILLINVEALALRIGSVGAAAIWPFIPIQAQPAQVCEHAFRRSRAHARLVEILDAHHELAACTASKEPGEQGRA
jgi:hypothetical protein